MDGHKVLKGKKKAQNLMVLNSKNPKLKYCSIFTKGNVLGSLLFKKPSSTHLRNVLHGARNDLLIIK